MRLVHLIPLFVLGTVAAEEPSSGGEDILLLRQRHDELGEHTSDLLDPTHADSSATEHGYGFDCNSTGSNHSNCSGDHGYEHGEKTPPTTIFFLFVAFAIGAVMRQCFHNSRIP
jgi:hypothetical protein